MNPSGIKSYQRLFLRAPYKKEVLISHQNEVIKARALNLSEGGVFFEFRDDSFKEQKFSCMLQLQELPLFKNHTTEYMKSFSQKGLSQKTIRFQGSVARAIEGEFFQVGLSIEKIDPVDQKLISKYVESMASNLVLLQVLIDSYTNDKKDLERINQLSQCLGYTSESNLRQTIQQDYKSLQWL